MPWFSWTWVLAIQVFAFAKSMTGLYGPMNKHFALRGDGEYIDGPLVGDRDVIQRASELQCYKS